MNDLEKKTSEFLDKKSVRQHDMVRYSHARINIGHTGGHVKTADWLAFQSDFAEAKDAVSSTFDLAVMHDHCQRLAIPALTIHSKPVDLVQFLLRPEMGKLLTAESEALLANTIKTDPTVIDNDLLIVISGGLSPIAIAHQAPKFLTELIKLTKKSNLSVAPICINPRGRVALGDQINQYFNAKMVIMLIGERPGLSTPDSLGVYFTYQAKPGCTDAERNCISNIHDHGLPPVRATEKLINLIKKSMSLGMSGVMLKDDEVIPEQAKPVSN
tara:strand:+ start:1607 stop:2419 length:813 start_codon:yes stop_codon:yes gene_type:complete